jgi:hypothetical protein
MRYPEVACSTHGRATTGSIVCIHVIAHGAPIAYVIDATDTEIGEVLCAPCVATGHHLDLLRLLCARCVERLLAARAPRPE